MDTAPASSSATPLRALLIEDFEDDALHVLRLLRQGGYAVRHERVDSLAATRAALGRQDWDVVICDFRMAGFDGFAALAEVRRHHPELPVIVVSGTIGEDTAVAMIKAGASDYVMKDKLARLVPVVRRELRESAARLSHRQAEESLRASELRFRQIAETIRDVFFLIDLADSRVFYVSPAYQEIWGRTCASLLADPRSWAASIHPEDRDHALRQYARGLTTSVDYEYRILRPDGGLRWIRVRGYPVLDEDGKPYRAAGIATDITDRKLAVESLRRSESIKSAILESSLDCIVTMDADGAIVDFNPAAIATFGWTRAQALGKPMVDLIVPPHLRDAHRQGFARYLRTGQGTILGKRVELSALRADGTEFPIELAVAAVGTAGSSLCAGFIRDITTRKEAETRIIRLNRVYAVLSGINALIVRVRVRDELFRESCRLIAEAGRFALAWIAVADRETMQLVPVAWDGPEQGFVDLVRGRLSLSDPPELQSIHVRAVMEHRAIVSNSVCDDPQIKFKPEHAQFHSRSVGTFPIVVGDTVEALLVLHTAEAGFFDDDELKLLLELSGDISYALAQIKKSELSNYIAYYDVLTGLANRTLFLERVEQQLLVVNRTQGKIAVFALDLDRFNSINDALGRHIGDELLKQVAQRLMSAGGSPARFARIGADHFAVILIEVENEEQVARHTEQRLGAVFDRPFRIAGHELKVGARCGIAMFPADGADADILFRHAETALVRAKSSGERVVFYAEEMTRRVAQNLILENQLRQAIDREEFVLYYQVKVDVDNRHIVGVEALIRWNSPELGLVQPDEFIPLLEETGLILQAGTWALMRAARDHRAWTEQGIKTPRIAVNVSQIQLRQRDFLQTVGRAIAQGAAPAGIDLEITESLLMEDVQSSIEKLKAVRALGVRISIDDFGTGYSSLASLGRLPVEALKIDRSFVVTMLEHTDSLTLVQAIIALAHSLKLKVVAEGVDSEGQAKMLQLLRCDEMQGYLFGRPVPFDEMTKLLRKGAG